jgi:protein SCO1/2
MNKKNINGSYFLLGMLMSSLIFLQSAVADNVQVKPVKQKLYALSKQSYKIPKVTLINRHEEEIQIVELLGDQHSVLLQFIFSTCATICPVMNAAFASAQDALEKIDPEYSLVTISIDPEQDTPRALDAYAKRFHAREQWHFLTGTREDIAKVQRAFDANYPGNNKMYHQPYTFMRPKGAKSWVRIDGLMSSADLVEEYRKLFESAGASN